MINIGVGDDLTIHDLAKAIRQVTGYSGKIFFDPSNPDGTPRKLLDVRRLRSMGWRANRLLSAGSATGYQDFQCSASTGLS